MATAVASPLVPVPFISPSLPPSLLTNANSAIPGPQLGWLRPTLASTPITEMRHRLSSDGYLFVKGALPRPDVQAMRAHYFAQFADADPHHHHPASTSSLLQPGTDPEDGIYNEADDPKAHLGIGGGDAEGEDLRVLIDAHTTPEYRAFVAHPALRELVRQLLPGEWDEDADEDAEAHLRNGEGDGSGDEDSVLLTRTMLRHRVPGGAGTGVHYDRLFLRGGPAYFLTAWVPIGDIAYNGGGLIYLENSVALGEAIEDDFSARAAAGAFTEEEKRSAFNRHMSANGMLAEGAGAFERDFAGPILKSRCGKVSAGDSDGEGEGRPYQFKWLIANYEAGDVVFHHPCTVHASCANQDPQGRIRLSTDLRFYGKRDFESGRADERWMKFWKPGDGL